jgi:hypothetical protein
MDTDYSKEFDQLLEVLFAYLTRDKVAAQLAAETRQTREGGKVGEEMVVVPRRRYEKLIEVYSINMAEISINELHDRLQMMPGKEEQAVQGVNYLAEAHRTYQEKYSDIVKGEEVDVKDLQQLFRVLAKKVGFENEWQRYHC